MILIIEICNLRSGFKSRNAIFVHLSNLHLGVRQNPLIFSPEMTSALSAQG
jgi:hypothetical protein